MERKGSNFAIWQPCRDEVNIQYVERLLAAEKLLAESNEGEEFEAMQARLRKDREERERSRKDLQEENDLLRRLNETLSIKIKDLEDPASAGKKLASKVGELCNFTIESQLIFSKMIKRSSKLSIKTFKVNMMKS